MKTEKQIIIEELQKIWHKLSKDDMKEKKAINDAIMYISYLEDLEKENRIIKY